MPPPGRRSADGPHRPGARRIWLARAMSGWAVAATALSLFLLAVVNEGRSPLPALFSTPSGAFTVWPALPGSAIAVTAALLGGLVATRRPANPVGWLLCTAALCASGFYLTYQYAVAAWLSGYGILPWATAAAWLAQPLWVAGFGVIMVMLLVFPDGHLPSPRWRPAGALVVGGFAGLVALSALTPGPLGDFPVHNPLGIGALEAFAAQSTPLTLAWPLFAGIALASVVARFRKARGVARQQLKMLVVPALLFPVAVIVYQLQVLPWPAPVLLLLAAGITVPLAIGQAVLRYRLYDIDRVISRTVAYGLLTGVLIGTYLLAVFTLQHVLQPLAGGSQLAVVGATLAAATVFQPARRRIQAGVDRHFNRARYDASRTIAAFRASLRADRDLDALAGDLCRAVRASVEPARLSLQLRPGQPAAVPPTPASLAGRPRGSARDAAGG
jgi:hypothetical protein